MVIDVIVPAFNEENGIAQVIEDIPKELVREIIVVNNNSTDKTAKYALQKGATVIEQPQMGYGNACLKGIEHISKKKDKPSIVVFIDADYSDFPEELDKLIKPIISDNKQMVIGSRALGKKEKGSMTPQQLFGNWLATLLIRLIYRVKYTDLGPFRAITYNELISLNMQDTTYGWTVEMQIKAIKNKLVITEVPVSYRKRIGHSKISGTIKGTIGAGYKIITTIFKYI